MGNDVYWFLCGAGGTKLHPVGGPPSGRWLLEFIRGEGAAPTNTDGCLPLVGGPVIVGGLHLVGGPPSGRWLLGFNRGEGAAPTKCRWLLGHQLNFLIRGTQLATPFAMSA